MPFSAKTLCLESPAKLNLFLDVINKRPDGYHNIVTLFERINLCDSVRLFAIHSDEIVVSCSHPDVPLDYRNLAWRAAELIKKSRDIRTGVKIEIDKRIPVGAGLGGGSSNAAAVLSGLSRLFKLKLDQKTLTGYANRLGSDVAFFILNKSFALGTDRGGDLKRVFVPKKLKLWHLLFIPPLKVMTKEIYGLHKSLALTRKPLDVNILIRYLKGKNIP
ncbi:MAG: 4-(cytidine 5'-diphospho)-2-C-methyl-D-erythritol kinase [Candidatus Omnitrophota bacterium]